MLQVDDYRRIRQAYYRDGLSTRAIAQRFGHGRDTIRKALANPEPQHYQRSQPPPAPVLGPYHAVIEQILTDDEHAPPKQRHTMMQVYRRLVDEHGYAGGYDAVRRYIGKHRQQHQPTHVPLDHEPGQRLECDFGHIHIDLPQGRTQVSIFVCTWSYSNYAFALTTPTERAEAVLAGMVAAFDFYGCVPREVWWDNPKSVVVRIGHGRERTWQERYLALASHYCFDPCACLPARPQEKPRAENRVKDLQQRWATPVPQVADLAALNQDLRDKCLKDRARTAARQSQSIGERFAADQAAGFPLPPRPFLPCIYQEAVAEPSQQVRFDNNRYSVPHTVAHGRVTVQASLEEVVVVHQGQVVARHPRCYGQGEQVLDPYHYLPRLDRHPAVLDHANVFRRWQLPAAFEQLRAGLEQRHGQRPGLKQYARVLQLLVDHPVEVVGQTIEQHLARALPLDATAIRLAVERLRPPTAPATPLPAVQVPLPDLSRFDQLLNQGGTSDA